MKVQRRRILSRSMNFRSSPDMLSAVNELANQMAMHPSQIVRAAVHEFVLSQKSKKPQSQARTASKTNASAQ